MQGKLIVFLALVLLIAAVIIPLNRTPNVFIPENFGNYSNELNKLGISDPYNFKYLKTFEVECSPQSTYQFRSIISRLKNIPHGNFVFYKEDGKGTVLTLFPDESSLKTLPSFCSVVRIEESLNESSKWLTEEKERLELYTELSNLTKNSSEKDFLMGKIAESKRVIAEVNKLESASKNNVSAVILHVKFKDMIGNLSTLNLIWTFLLLVTLSGVLSFRKNRGAFLVFLALFLLSLLFVGTIIYNWAEWREQTEALNSLIEMTKNGNGSVLTWSSMHMSFDGIHQDDVERLKLFFVELNTSPYSDLTEGTYRWKYFQFYTLIPANESDKAEKLARRYGFYYYTTNTSNWNKAGINSLRLENEILRKHFEELPPKLKNITARIIKKNENELYLLMKGREMYEISGWVSVRVPYSDRELVSMSHNLAGFGIGLLLLMILISSVPHRR